MIGGVICALMLIATGHETAGVLAFVVWAFANKLEQIR
jgi:hypothetical protein